MRPHRETATDDTPGTTRTASISRRPRAGMSPA